MSAGHKIKMRRREFLGTAATAAVGFTILKPSQIRGTEANSAVRLGILGCGGRGTTVGTGFIDNTNTRVVALADRFEDQLATAQKHFDEHQSQKGYPAIDPSQLFKGPNASDQIVTSKEVDAILVSTPPFFHPQHLEKVVSAGKHVYLEKPVGIDVPGVNRVLQAATKISGKLSLAVGFQIRKAPPFVELVKRDPWRCARQNRVRTGLLLLPSHRSPGVVRCLAGGKAPAELDLGPSVVWGHYRRAERSCHRHLQLVAPRAPGEGGRGGEPEAPR